MKLHIAAFGGVAPRINPRDLPEIGAQVALNIKSHAATLEPIRAPGAQIASLWDDAVRTIYRFGDAAEGVVPTWFGWRSPDVDVVRSQLTDDQYEWTFFTGETARGDYLRGTYAGLHTHDDPDDPIELPPLGSMRMALPGPTSSISANSRVPDYRGPAFLTITNATATIEAWSDVALPDRLAFQVWIGPERYTFDPAHLHWAVSTDPLPMQSYDVAYFVTTLNRLPGLLATYDADEDSIKVETDAIGEDAYIKVVWGEPTQPEAPAAHLSYPYDDLDRPFNIFGVLEGFGQAQRPGTIETRVYTYTRVYRSETGYEIESQPAPVDENSTVDVYPLPIDERPDEEASDASVRYNVTLAGFTLWDGEETDFYSHAKRSRGEFFYRIYRAVAGEYILVDEWFAIGEPPPVYTDTKSSSVLELSGLPSLTWASPPQGMRGLVNLANGVLAGFIGRDVYFSEPYSPHAWPLQYVQTVDYPIVGLGTLDTTLVVLTEGTPYFMQGAHPDGMTVVQGQLNQACVSKRSIVSMNNAVIYASPDGLVSISPGGSAVLTLPLLEAHQWRLNYNPETIQAYEYEGQYIAFCTAAVPGERGYGFVYDPTQQTFIHHGVYGVTSGYNHKTDGSLYIGRAIGGSLVVQKWADSASSYSHRGWWKSKVFVLPHVTSFSWIQVEAAEDAYPVECAVTVDGVSHSVSIPSRAPARLPVLPGREVEIEVFYVFKPVYSITLAQSSEELF